MAFVPTLVIGVGGAGLKVIRTYKELVKMYGDTEILRSIAIDSNTEDIDRSIMVDSSTAKVELTETNLNLSSLIGECPYLYDGITPKGKGALRDRVYGRFLYDLHKKDARVKIKKFLVELQNSWQTREGGGTKPAEIIIWIVHSIGGGTGSGTFPSIVADVKQIAHDVLEERGDSRIKPYIFCVGILPSASNIFDLANQDLNPLYFANSYAALREIDQIAYPPQGLALHPFGRTGPEKPLLIPRRPFDRYFLYGINEEKITTKSTSENTQEIEDYLQNSNNVIANMMFTLTQHPDLENLWLEIESPYIPFGESELFVPIQKIIKVAQENDKLGKVLDISVKDSLKQNVLDLLDKSTDNVNNQALDKQCKSVYDAYHLRGLTYFAGILQNEFRRRTHDYKSQYEDRVSEIWSDLCSFDWSKSKVENLSNYTTNQKYEKIRQVFLERKEENQKNIDSLFRKFTKPLHGETLKENNKKIDNTLSDLQAKKAKWETMDLLISHIDTKLCKDLKIKELHDQCGTPAIQSCVDKRENALDRLKDKLMKAGSGRRISISLPMNILDQLTLTDAAMLRVNPDAPTSEFLSNLQFSNEQLMGIIVGRRNQAARSRELNIRAKMRTPGCPDIREDLFTECNSSNLEFLEKYKSAFFNMRSTNIQSKIYDKEKYLFVNFSLEVRLDDLDEYSQRKQEYDEARLKSATNIPREVGTIFAYPEWFPEDEEVRNVYPKLFRKK